MSIRLRTVAGIRVALCGVESDAMPGDVYLDDGDHYALAAKFSRDWSGRVAGWRYPAEWALMDTQKKRDAEEEHVKWAATRLSEGDECPAPDCAGELVAVPDSGRETAKLVCVACGETAEEPTS